MAAAVPCQHHPQTVIAPIVKAIVAHRNRKASTTNSSSVQWMMAKMDRMSALSLENAAAIANAMSATAAIAAVTRLQLAPIDRCPAAMVLVMAIGDTAASMTSENLATISVREARALLQRCLP
jgi:hypothetical protein